ncbi:MAG: alpha/beta fold hydrolase [Aquabacterium sp.]
MRLSAVNLLCLPCAGASATMYVRWRRQMPSWINVVPVELPGRGGRMGEPFMEDFGTLVDQLCKEQAPVLQGSFALFGHSMGALLAYGLTQHLRRAGLALPRVLFVSGSAAPAKRDPRRFPEDGNDTQLLMDLRKQGGTPDAVFENEEFLRMTMDTLNADYRVCRSFVHQPAAPLPMPIHAFAGRADDISAEQMVAWRAEAGGAFSLRWFEGGHFFLRQQESKLLQAMTEDLEQCLPALA